MKDIGFKIIAIKPLKGCSPEYLKILQEEKHYFFYNNYKIDSRDRISFTNSLPDNFYKVNKIDVNICAIVGKNGSGKSTIIELLFRIINNLAKHQNEIKTSLNIIKGLKADIYFHTDSYYKLRINNAEVEIYKYDGDGNKTLSKVTNFRLRDFFYTVAVNYSHYAYNTNDLVNEVNWLDSLFHKNDGYQIPLVINPMRINGDIDINNENHLVKSRLIANLLRPVVDKNFNFRSLTDKLVAASLKLTLNKSKEDAVLYEIKDKRSKTTEEVKLKSLNFNANEVLSRLNFHYNFNYERLNKQTNKIALDYLIYKIVSIAIKYDEYEGYFIKSEKKFHEETFEKFLGELIADDSHIAFKLKQTLNFLKYQHIELKDQTLSLEKLSKDIFSILEKNSRKRIDIIELIPPPIFSIDILLKTKRNNERQIAFNKLSSGEKQQIYSVSSILYHLVNLNSIGTTKKRTGYKFVNIVLEEIELYFHPEMQRTYIKYILDSISKIELKRIKGINFCFVTHSPFILSDIPDSNILFLNDDGTPKSDTTFIKTFGGNIHDLLADSFFLGNGFIGAFAKKKIQNIIDQLENKVSVSGDRIRREDILKGIEIIGEPFLKEKLSEMYYEKYSKQKRIDELKDEIKRLEND